jgi:hypothetical protein
MDKAKIFEKPNPNVLKRVQKWQEVNIGKSDIEINELPLGDYKIWIEYETGGRHPYMDKSYFGTPVTLREGKTLEDLKREAIAGVACFGVHNFASLRSTKVKPGIPVKIELVHSSGKKIEFTQHFDTSGFAVREPEE